MEWRRLLDLCNSSSFLTPSNIGELYHNNLNFYILLKPTQINLCDFIIYCVPRETLRKIAFIMAKLIIPLQHVFNL